MGIQPLQAERYPSLYPTSAHVLSGKQLNPLVDLLARPQIIALPLLSIIIFFIRGGMEGAGFIKFNIINNVRYSHTCIYSLHIIDKQFYN